MSMSVFTGKQQGALYMSSQVVIRKRVPLLQLQNENAAGVKYDMSMKCFFAEQKCILLYVSQRDPCDSTLQTVEWSHVWVFYLN